MNKHTIILMLTYFLLPFACLSQIPDTSTVKQVSYSPPPPRTPQQTFSTVNFVATANCYLRIDGKPYGLINKGTKKTVKLSNGQHKLFFESDETGEVYIEPRYLVSREAVKSDYEINFPNKVYNVKLPATEPSGEDTKMKALIDKLATGFVSLPGGSFSMGLKGGAPDEIPYTVTVTPFKMSSHEVTQQQWESIMGYNNSSNKGCKTCPVENVSWEEVHSFISKINKSSNKKFRLPTETEWEYIAKKESEKLTGEEFNSKRFDKKMKDVIKKAAWCSANANNKTQPVGGKQTSELKIYDLYGNVAEWCADSYKVNPADSNSGSTQPDASAEFKVVRGGAFNDDDSILRPQVRNKAMPSFKSNAIGFRLVMDEK